VYILLVVVNLAVSRIDFQKDSSHSHVSSGTEVVKFTQPILYIVDLPCGWWSDWLRQRAGFSMFPLL